MEMRRYRSADYEAAWELHTNGIKQVGIDIEHGSWEADMHDIENHYIGGGGDFLVGTLDGDIIAIAAFRKVSDTCAEIKRMRVAQEYQGRGLGEAMLLRLLELATERGFTEFCLDTTGHMVAAQRLYEKHGFREVRRDERLGFEIIFYEK